MPDALRANGKRFANGRGPGFSPRGIGQPQSGRASLSVKLTKRFRPGAPLVPAEADADDRSVVRLHLDGFAKDPLCLLEREVPHRVEDPVEREPQFALCALASPFQPGKNRLECSRIVIAPEID